MKRYCVKLKRQTWFFDDGKFASKQGYNTHLSWEQSVNLIHKNGIHLVEFIRHDDKNPKNTHKLAASDMLAMWKAVAKKN
jgi:hypothetical protein